MADVLGQRVKGVGVVAVITAFPLLTQLVPGSIPGFDFVKSAFILNL